MLSKDVSILTNKSRSFLILVWSDEGMDLKYLIHQQFIGIVAIDIP